MRPRLLAFVLLLTLGSGAQAATVLIRDATVHTVTDAGVRPHTDILIRDGYVVELGQALRAPADAVLIEAAGRAVTPGLFGGAGHLGIEEIGLEPTVDDYALKLGSMRPEFDVTPAFDPDSVVLGVGRLGGVSFAQLAPTAESGGKGAGGTIIAGQGGKTAETQAYRGNTRALFIATGGAANALSGDTRAAQFMLLQQALTEVHAPKLLLANDARLLTPAGRQALADYSAGARRVVFDAPPTSARSLPSQNASTCARRCEARMRPGAWRRSLPPRVCRCCWIRSMTCRRVLTPSAPRWRTPRACSAPASRSPSASTTRSHTISASCAREPASPSPTACPGKRRWLRLRAIRRKSSGSPIATARSPAVGSQTSCSGAATRWK